MTRTARKLKPTSEARKTSALESARRAGIVGAYSGPADLATSRKRYRRAKSHAKAGAKRNGFSTSRGRRSITADTVRQIEAQDDEA